MLFNIDAIVALIIFNIMSCMVEGGRLLCDLRINIYVYYIDNKLT
jgi:hypothetical protein